jgi:hypothetical protein
MLGWGSVTVRVKNRVSYIAGIRSEATDREAASGRMMMQAEQ